MLKYLKLKPVQWFILASIFKQLNNMGYNDKQLKECKLWWIELIRKNRMKCVQFDFESLNSCFLTQGENDISDRSKAKWSDHGQNKKEYLG